MPSSHDASPPCRWRRCLLLVAAVSVQAGVFRCRAANHEAAGPASGDTALDISYAQSRHSAALPIRLTRDFGPRRAVRLLRNMKAGRSAQLKLLSKVRLPIRPLKQSFFRSSELFPTPNSRQSVVRDSLQALFDSERVANARVEVFDAGPPQTGPLRLRFVIQRQVQIGDVKFELTPADRHADFRRRIARSRESDPTGHASFAGK